MRLRGLLFALSMPLLLAASACGDDSGDSGSATTGATTTETSATTTGETSTMTAASETASASSATSSDASSTSAGTSTTTTGDTSGTSDSASTGGGSSSGGEATGSGVCEPTQDDGECLTCAKPECCPQWLNCENDDICSCILECHLIDGGSLGQCRNQCGGATELYNALYFCGQMFCLNLCDWDSP